MFSPSRSLPALLLAATIATLGCHAQPPAGPTLPPDVARKVEVLLRQKASLPPGSTINISPRAKGPLPGYDQIDVSFTSIDGNTSHPVTFLISEDNKTLAQFNRFDLTKNPKDIVSAAGRPGRGGPANAPVVIVGFDDLECPYCARAHATMFPAITDRYKDQVHIVYKDFPLKEIHPWAMRAAVDSNCVGDQSTPGYWSYVDKVHAKAGEMGAGPAGADGKVEKTIDRANQQLDGMAREEAVSHKLDMTKLNACLAKQDTTQIDASRELGRSLGVDSTPSLFINGDKIDGALPLEFLFKIIDQALIAEGKTPPPPYVPPAPAVPPATPATK